MKSWFSITQPQAKAAAPEAPPVPEVSIYDDIGAWGVTAKDFIAAVNALDAAEIKLSISSAGGSVFDALAMYNALRMHKATINVVIMGVAASAASLVAMAGDRIEMPANTFMMVHNPMAIEFGNADELRETADVLDKVASSLVSIYCKRTGKGEDEIKALLAAETYMTATEAVEMGFADAIIDEMAISARFDVDRLPQSVQDVFAKGGKKPESPPPAAPVPAGPVADARQLAQAVIAKAQEKGLMAHVGAVLADAQLADEAAMVAALDEVGEIVAVCASAGMPEAADGLIRARVPLAAVCARISEARAALDAEIQLSAKPPAPPETKKPTINSAAIYAARRQSR